MICNSRSAIAKKLKILVKNFDPQWNIQHFDWYENDFECIRQQQQHDI